MKPTPLLDFWQKPAGAGAPVALFATTFAFDPDFFEQNCLARFLEVSSVNEGTGSVDDVVASVELHELLQNTCVTVLADRSAPVQRASLLWDLLGCKVNGGLLHAKVAVLLWEKASRVILGSANLTAAGYRRQIELGLAADLGTRCLLPPDVLTAIADELESYLLLVPGHASGGAVFSRAASTLGLFRQRIVQSSAGRSGVRVAFAPTNAKAGALDSLQKVWSGQQPMCATHLSPFWDSKDQSVLAATRKLLTGRPASERSQRVAVVLGPGGQISFPRTLAKAVDAVWQLKELDKEVRLLHAKCLLLVGKAWVAALVGSSNHTRAGFGIVKNGPCHREMNLWMGAPLNSKEGQSLVSLVQLGTRAPEDAEEVDVNDEDEVVLPVLPGCFGLCRVVKGLGKPAWALHFGIAPTKDMPASWSIGMAPGDIACLTRALWEKNGALGETVIALTQDALPMYVLVRWDGHEIPWAVVTDDRHNLPPVPALSSLRAQQLLDALASGRSLAQTLREELEDAQAKVSMNVKSEAHLDPLKRFDLKSSLLRQGRALAASLSAMQRRLERPVITVETLRSHLASPLGPEFVAAKVKEAWEQSLQTPAETLFTIAEIALAVGRVDWAHVLEHTDQAQGLALVSGTFMKLEVLIAQIADKPSGMHSYAVRAIKEARRCLAC